MVLRTGLLLIVAALPCGALAQTSALRIPRLTADDRCPQGGDGEIVVCGRNDDRYRLPLPEERDTIPRRDDRMRRTDALDAARPTGCSVTGGAGMSGCSAEEWGRIRGKR